MSCGGCGERRDQVYAAVQAWRNGERAKAVEHMRRMGQSAVADVRSLGRSPIVSSVPSASPPKPPQPSRMRLRQDLYGKT